MGPDAVAQYASVMRPLLIASGIFGILIAPAVPALADAVANGDLAWARSLVIRSYALVAGLSGAVGLVLFIFGPTLFLLWLRTDLGIDRTLTGIAGLYFMFWMVQFLGFNLLLGLGRLRWLGPLFLLEAAFALTLGHWLGARFGPTGMALALLLATVACTGWILPVMLWRAVLPR
jgi:O-antigen/teichoic acid export membrane protein